MEFSIRTVAMIALGVMVVVLVYTMFDTWFIGIGEDFVGNIEFESPQD